MKGEIESGNNMGMCDKELKGEKKKKTKKTEKSNKKNTKG